MNSPSLTTEKSTPPTSQDAEANVAAIQSVIHSQKGLPPHLQERLHLDPQATVEQVRSALAAAKNHTRSSVLSTLRKLASKQDHDPVIH